MPKAATPITLTQTQRIELQRLVRAARSPQQMVLRARILLRADDGEDNTHIAAALGIGANTVAKWRRRFATADMAGLADAARSGRPARLPDEVVRRVLTEVTRPPKGRTRWSVRSMARHAGLSKSAVQQLWARNDLKPHRLRTFKVSRDPLFEPKFWDVIGLYLDPPHKALVLCCDEKSQCQALERTQPGLPLGIGHIRTKTHDYTRHGTVTLFAALNYLEGKILHQSAARHRHQEWLRFLRHLDAQTPPDLDLHLILDNYATHKHAKVRAWLARHPRFHLHFTPTASSWLNLVERFFAGLTADVVREGSFGSVPALVAAMETYLAERNLAPKPYRWQAKGADILAKLQRAKRSLATVHSRTSGTGH